MDLPIIAGTISTVLFMSSTLPMLHKAFRSKDLQSYSFGNMLLSNSGNAVHSLYVYSLPPGPIWWLHTFHLVTTGVMLAWYLRFERRPGFGSRLALPRFPPSPAPLRIPGEARPEADALRPQAE